MENPSINSLDLARHPRGGGLSTDLSAASTFAARHPYRAAVIGVLAAVGIRLAFAPILGSNAPYLSFVPAIILVAWLAGRSPALLTMGRYSFAIADLPVPAAFDERPDRSREIL